MVDGALRWASVLATLLVVAGFAMFAVDHLNHASREQVSALADGDRQENLRESRHSGFREGIDDVNDALLRPFAGVASSSNDWVRRGVPTLLAVLVYGLGLGFLARYVRIRS